jgi:cysteine synthase
MALIPWVGMAAIEVARGMEAGARVVTIVCDGGERYLC